MAQVNNQVSADIDLYVDEWTRVMLDIWKEKVERLRIIRSGAFHESFRSAIQDVEQGKTITMRFLSYGLFQAHGSGYGYSRDNGGDLPFLDKDYRHRHRLDVRRRVGPAWGGYLSSGKPRKRRDWFSKKLYMSVMAMKEDLARIGADNLSKVLCEALDNVESTYTL